MLLELFGHEARVCYTGPEGLQAAREWRPDVILCDIGLPGMSGYEVARAVRQDPDTAGVLLIAVTGYGRAEDVEKSRRAGFNQHLTKPVDPQELLENLVFSQ